MTGDRPPRAGFTMVELMVVMAVIGLLLSIAVPHYLDALERGRAHVLAQNLAQLREALDRHHGDRGAYPDRLDDLVERRYLRAVPLNPFTNAADWQLVSPPAGAKGAIYDVAESADQRAARERRADPAPAAALPDDPASAPAWAGTGASAPGAGRQP